MDSHIRRIGRGQTVSRRDFLRVAAGVGAGVVLLGGCGSDDGNGGPTSTPGIVVDPPPETTTIRLPKTNLFAPWTAPLYLAEQFLPAEGFTNVQYIDLPVEPSDTRALAAGEIDIGVPYASSVMVAADRGDPLVTLAGVINSPFVLFGNEKVQSLRDLKGKRIWVQKRDATDSVYAFWAVLLAYVGIDLEHEVEFVELSSADVVQQALAGAIDAWLAPRPYSTLLRNANIGHVILDGTVDPPWSHYFFAMATGNRAFVEKRPVATKRALRAILKATDMCGREPERAARYLLDKGFLDKGFTPLTYESTLDALTGVSYAAWREFNPEDTLRFYALRLREAGLVKSTPDELIARSTNFRYLDEIKRELGV